MYISKVFLTDNFVPDYVTDQFRRRVAGYEVTLREDEDYKEAERFADEKIKEYIKANTVENNMSGTITKIIPPEDAGQEEEINRLCLEVQEKLNSFEFREDAQEYLDTTDFKMHIPSKMLVNKKPSKPL